MNLTTEHAGDLGVDVRDGLGLLVDLLLPGTDTMPAGREVGADGELIDRVLDADPTLRDVVIGFGRRAAEAGEVTLADLESWSTTNDCERVVFALTAAYYLSPRAKRAIGYPGQERRPVAEAKPDEVVTDELLAPVRERGTIFVPTPE